MTITLRAPVSVSFEGKDYDLAVGEVDVPEGVDAQIDHHLLERDPKVLALQADAPKTKRVKE